MFFVVNGSVCNIQCDAFLCPAAISIRKGSLMVSIAKQWEQTTLLQNEILCKKFKRPCQFEMDTKYMRVVKLRDWPWKEFQQSRQNPPPFMVAGEVSIEKSKEYADMENKKKNNNNHRIILPPEEQHIEGLMETARQFLQVVLTELQKQQPSPQSLSTELPFGYPGSRGTGGGLAADLTGQIVFRLLSVLSQFVALRKNVDVVLVCADEATYTLMLRRFGNPPTRRTCR